MKMILKLFSFVVLFFTIVILFLPKEQLFYKLINTASQNKVYLSDYTFKENLVSSNIKNINTIYDGINIANIKNIDAKVLLVYNNINITGINLDESLNSFVPSKIKSINIRYSVINPLNVFVDVYSKLYSIKIDFDLIDMKINAVFKTSKFFRKKYKKLLRELKYDKDIKDYTYEYKL